MTPLGVTFEMAALWLYIAGCKHTNRKRPRPNQPRAFGISGARDRARTGDPHVGNVALYQLSYSCLEGGPIQATLRRLVKAVSPDAAAAILLKFADLFPPGRDVSGGVSGVEHAVTVRDDPS